MVPNQLFKAKLEFTLSQDPAVCWSARRFDSVEQMAKTLKLEVDAQGLDVWIYNGSMSAVDHIIFPTSLLPAGIWVLAVPWGESMAAARKKLREFMRTPQGAENFRLPRPLP